MKKVYVGLWCLFLLPSTLWAYAPMDALKQLPAIANVLAKYGNIVPSDYQKIREITSKMKGNIAKDPYFKNPVMQTHHLHIAGEALAHATKVLRSIAYKTNDMYNDIPNLETEGIQILQAAISACTVVINLNKSESAKHIRKSYEARKREMEALFSRLSAQKQNPVQ